MSITQFRDRHRGEDIYVLGAGNTLSYLDPRFFDNKVTIGVNLVPKIWRPTTYAVSKYGHHANEVAEAFPEMQVIAPTYEWGNRNAWPITSDLPNVHIFDHRMNPGEHFDAVAHWPDDPDFLVVSWSTIATAMHFAAYLGAASIIMVAHDCGQLGEKLYVGDYPQGLDPQPFEVQSIGVKHELERRYGARVYSLNPFLNYALEGTPFVGSVRINA
jgi:hypothetical protein